jgi:phosphatidylethanolamine-binding protein (PEBP) family uncharacterized protein
MRTILAVGFTLALCSGAMADMSMSFEWGPTKKCFDSKSPPITLSSVPAGTAMLEITMVDRNAPGFDHGGGKVPYTGQASLPYGAFKYQGPCPPMGQHFYRITVKAQDAAGKTLATAKADSPFPK